LAYSKPPSSNIPFQFTSGGYIAPVATDIEFDFDVGELTSWSANLRAALDVWSLQTETYTYVKDYRTYVLGFSGAGIQVLREASLYGGIRDLGAVLYRQPTHVDLPAYLLPVVHWLDLGAYIRSTIQATKNLGASIAGFRGLGITYDLAASLVAQLLKGTGDIAADIFGYPPIDLPAILNVIEIRNLPAVLTAVLFKGEADLPALIDMHRRGYFDLSAFITSTRREGDLPASITVMHPFDLGASLYGGYFGVPANLNAYLATIQPIDLPASLHGYDYLDILGILTGGFGPGDLQASILGVTPANLTAAISGFLGIHVPVDLPASLAGYGTGDLSAYLLSTQPADLLAILTASGQVSDLPAILIPRTIYIKKALQVALLEHKNLTAVINFSCFASEWRALSAYVYPIYKMDLGAYIVGWFQGWADTLVDIGAIINTTDYYVEDRFTSRFFSYTDQDRHTLLKTRFTSTEPDYYVIDTLPILFGTFYWASLTASITGMLTSTNLTASITPTYDFNYTALPSYISPKTHEVVINLARWEEQWQRFVEIWFESSGFGDYKYFYVEAENKVYRVNRDRHWTIWFKSYKETEDQLIERTDVRNKYLFRMSNYSTVDEAVRDFIDRISTYRRAALAASITGIEAIQANLGATLSVDFKYKWLKNLKGTITGIP
jgi:hypothetical protein